MQFDKIMDRFTKNPILYVILGTLIAITVSRAYVFLGGSVTLAYHGIYLHHLFYGVIFVSVTGILSFLWADKRSKYPSLNIFLALLFGFGLGLIIDESNLLILTGQEYSLSLYYSSYNTIVEFTVVLLMVIGLIASVLTQAIMGRHRKKR